MAGSINTYLKSLSYIYYLKKDSDEIDRINRSLNNLLANLDKELEYLVSYRFVFGSYDRDTILRRSIDSKSDIDLMVVFNHTEYERTPETYRAWLKNFADKYYKDRYGSEVTKTFPTVTIKLNNISYDLVPAKQENSFLFGSKLYIPGSGNYWRETNPSDVKENLLEVNKKYNYIVKPIIRLLKGWNAYNGHPFDSYELEMKITEMNFYGDNYQSGFFYAVGQLSTSWGDSEFKKNKLNSLKYNIGKVKDELEVYNIERAKHWLHKALPI